MSVSCRVNIVTVAKNQKTELTLLAARTKKIPTFFGNRVPSWRERVVPISETHESRSKFL